MVRQMGAPDDEAVHVSRRGFLGWGAALLSAAVVPGATLALAESPAGAATLSPATPSAYGMATWQGLVQHSIVATSSAGSSETLKVVRVTNLELPGSTNMSGEVFSVGFQAATPLPAGIYTISAPGLGHFPLFLAGATGTQALINRRIPAAG